MQKITNAIELQNAIQIVEKEHALKGLLLKEQLYCTYESLKPINIIKNTLRDVVSATSLTDNLLGTVTGLAGGYLSKKMVVGTSGNIIRNLLGSVLQFGVTSVVAKHPEAIKYVGQFIFQHLFRKKENKSDSTLE